MAGTEFLTAAEERALIARAQAGDIAARNTLIERNIRFIWSEANKFALRCPFHDTDDFLAEATFAYIACIKRFDLSRGLRLSTYAAATIRNSLIRAHENLHSVVRVPPPARRGLGTPETQRQAQAALHGVISIHEPAGDGDGTVGDKILGRESAQSDDMPPLADVFEAAKHLPVRWERVIVLRAAGTPFAKIAKELHVSAQRVQEIEGQAFKYLRRLMGLRENA